MSTPSRIPEPSLPTLAPVQVAGAVRRDAGLHREAFLHADPFKHLVIDDFFEPAFAERLLAEFPSFNPGLARNEIGGEGKKAVNTKLREISPAYQELYEMISSQPFLALVSQLSGIPDLLFDPKMYGGGTHDNLHGQELDPHVDFNYDESNQLHRRLNLIVYMNKEWESEWGGALEIHSNPRDPGTNRIRSYDPLFNRCVMFETNEYSWHGFPKLDLPPDKRHLSRKSISIYLYTKDRPAEEIAPMHATFYVQRPLPKHFVAGHTLTAQDVDHIQLLLRHRDNWVEYYQRLELEKNRDLANRSRSIRDLTSRIRAPLTGYILQDGPPVGLYADTWVASRAELRIRPLLPVSEIALRGWRPVSAPAARIRISVDNGASTEVPLPTDTFEVILPLTQPLHATFGVKIAVEWEGQRFAATGDDRDLAFVLSELRARHPGIQDSGPPRRRRFAWWRT